MTEIREAWEDEVLEGHRWGCHGQHAAEEHERLIALWQDAKPLDDDARELILQILCLEICNWRLEDSVLELCHAIGQGRPATFGIGHTDSITDERWRQVLAYHAALRSWQTAGKPSAYDTLLKNIDASGSVRDRVFGMLGERSELKQLYVERFCLCLERWLREYLPPQHGLLCGHRAAVEALESEIRKRDDDGRILNAMRGDGDGRLRPCGHKAFRRYDIILSSIGCGKWRGAMPACGNGGTRRADTLGACLAPIQAWLDRTERRCDYDAILGEPNPRKRFLVSLLVSLLRSQELSARKR